MTELRNLFANPSISTPFYPPLKERFSSKGFGDVFDRNTSQQNQKSSTLALTRSLGTHYKQSAKELSKSTVPSGFIEPEISLFRKIVMKETITKSIIFSILLSLAFVLMKNFSRRVFFELQLLVWVAAFNFSGILFSIRLGLAESKSIIGQFLKHSVLILFAAAFYDCIILTDGELMESEVVLGCFPHIVWTVVAVVNFKLSQTFKPYFTESLENFNLITGLVQHLQQFCLEAKKHFYSLWRIRGVMTLVTLIIMSFAMVRCALQMDFWLFASILRPSLLIRSLMVFVSIEWLVFVVYYWTWNFQSLILGKAKYKNVEIFMQILRMDSSSARNDKMEQICLKEVAGKLRRQPNFLRTPVNFNHLINEYGDILQAFCSNKLRYLILFVNQKSIEFNVNCKIQSVNKSIKEDAFVYCRKISAGIRNIAISHEVVRNLEANKLMFLLMVRMMQNNALKRENLDKVQELCVLLKKFPMQELRMGIIRTKVAEWQSQLQELNIQLKESNSGGKVSRLSETAVNGWRQYRN